MSRRRTLADQSGMTLVELMVAAFILLVGLLGVVAMMVHATDVAGTNNGRVGATNLAREILEDARSIDYDQLNPTQIAGALQGRGLGGSGNPWSLTRRGVDYSANVTVCTLDQPKDGLAATPPQNACEPRADAIVNAPAESNPDDFRNVTVVLSWNDRGRARTLTQNSLIANPAGGLGPRIVEFPEPVHITSPSQTEVRWDNTVKTSDAAAVRWVADDADSHGQASQGNATGGNTYWTIAWDIGTYGSGQFVYDGAYTVTAQAFDTRGVAGESRLAAVLLNRRKPFAPPDLTGGRNGRFGGIVELKWNASPERDVLGYRVYRQQATGSPELICPATAQAVHKVTTCSDLNPPPGDVTYMVYAVDRQDLSQADSPLREGDPATITVTSAGAAPPVPTDPRVDTDPDSGLPRLQWTQPASTSDVRFYRIYRDTGTELKDRYAVTANADPMWTDPEPGTATSHTYWVAAVDKNQNESAPLGPLRWPGP